MCLILFAPIIAILYHIDVRVPHNCYYPIKHQTGGSYCSSPTLYIETWHRCSTCSRVMQCNIRRKKEVFLEPSGLTGGPGVPFKYSIHPYVHLDQLTVCFTGFRSHSIELSLRGWKLNEGIKKEKLNCFIFLYAGNVITLS